MMIYLGVVFFALYKIKYKVGGAVVKMLIIVIKIREKNINSKHFSQPVINKEKEIKCTRPFYCSFPGNVRYFLFFYPILRSCP